jgi:hypothetical protein
VVALAYCTAALIVTDFTWRNIQLPFERLAIYSFGLFLVGALVLLIVGHRSRRRRLGGK